eukprot:11684209-Ditylum_brightwellii.AAC.1
MSMMLVQLPAEEDYWKKGKCDAITYPAFKQWMPHGSISAAAKARDTLWKARDAIIAVRDVCKRFMPTCCGVASIDEARIPCNGR